MDKRKIYVLFAYVIRWTQLYLCVCMYINMSMYICIYAGIFCVCIYGTLSSNRTKYCGIFMNQTEVNFQISYLEGYNREPQIYKDTQCVNPPSGKPGPDVKLDSRSKHSDVNPPSRKHGAQM